MKWSWFDLRLISVKLKFILHSHVVHVVDLSEPCHKHNSLLFVARKPFSWKSLSDKCSLCHRYGSVVNMDEEDFKLIELRWKHVLSIWLIKFSIHEAVFIWCNHDKHLRDCGVYYWLSVVIISHSAFIFFYAVCSPSLNVCNGSWIVQCVFVLDKILLINK